MSMTIDRVGYIDPIPPGKKPGRSGQVSQDAKTDSISVSQEAAAKAELYKAIEIVSAAPDVREERIQELRNKINDPSYINDTLLRDTADKIMEAFGL